jgi:long-chain acyl-CoA synthetase
MNQSATSHPSYDKINAMLTAPQQMFEIEQRSIRGSTVRAWKNAPPTLRHILESSRRFSDRVYIAYEDEQLTFGDHYRLVGALATRLVKDFGIGRGDRVAIAMRNYPEWSAAFWAIVSIGAVAVPLNAWWTGDELAYGIKDSGSRLLFADAERAERVAGRIGELGLKGVIVARGENLASQYTDLRRLLADLPADIGLPETAPCDPEDDATILYTSGTTGFPKGALGTHRNICSMAVSGAFLGVRALLREGGSLNDLAQMQKVQQVLLLAVPLFHVVGSHGVLLQSMVGGSKIVMMHKWDAQRALELMEREKVTALNATPTMVWQLVDHPDIAARNLAAVGVVGYGGAPAPPELRRRIAELMPAAMPGTGYGITETSSVISGMYGSDYRARPASAGVAIPICDIKAVDEHGRDAPPGQLGELWIRGSNVVKGYWNKPEATAEAFTDGWFHSGDIGRIDEDGYVYIVDRKKDMIIRGGENVYCAEVEAALMDHPAVKGAAVIGIPDRVLGEQVGAVVHVDATQDVSAEDLQEHARRRLAAFKVPSRLWLREEPLPLGATGKIMKRELREQLLARQQDD